MASILSIGTSALLSMQQALNTTGHNIANVNTEGYSRQTANFTTRTPQFLGGHFVGSGVQVGSLERSYNQFLTGRVFDHGSSQAYYDTFATMSERVDNLVGDANAGMTKAAEQFFSSMQALSNDPGSTTARQLVLSNAQNLANQFQSLDRNLADLGGEATQRATAVVAEINSLAEELAALNSDIRLAKGTDRGSPPNDLFDERDRLLGELSTKVGMSYNEQRDGTVDVMIGTGQPLVINEGAQTLTISSSATAPGQLQLGIASVNGVVINVDNLISGGELQGLVDFSGRILDATRNGVGRMAMSISETFNAQHQLGLDLNDALGVDFFTSPSPTVLADPNNTGAATVTVTLDDVIALEPADYQLDYSGTQWQVTRTSDNAVVSGAGPSFSLDGITINISGAPAPGDSFLVRPVHDAAGQFGVQLVDSSQVAAAAPLRSNQALTNSGTGVINKLVVNATGGLPLAGPVTLTFNPDALGAGLPGYDVSGGPAGPIAYNPATDSGGKDISVSGYGDMSFTLFGLPQAGDTLTIESNTGASGDNRNALLLSGLQREKLFDGGTATYEELYGQVVGAVGIATGRAQSGLQTETLLMDQAQSARDSVAGVNLEEEAANLLRFQQAYQAAAQVVAIADEMFQTLLNATSR